MLNLILLKKVELETIDEEFYKLINDTMTFLSTIFVNIYDLSQNSIKNFKYLKENRKNDLQPSLPHYRIEPNLMPQNVEEIDDDIIEIKPDDYIRAEKNNSKNDSILSEKRTSNQNTTSSTNKINSAIRASITTSPTKKTSSFRRRPCKTNKLLPTETANLTKESQLKERLRSQAKPKVVNQILLTDEVDISKLTVHIFGLQNKKDAENKKILESILAGISFQKIDIHQNCITLKFSNEDATRRAARKLIEARPHFIVGLGSQYNELKKKYENKKAQLKAKNAKIAESKNAKKTNSEDLTRSINSVVEFSRQYAQTVAVSSSSSVIPNVETPPLSRSESTNSSTDIFNSKKSNSKEKDSFTCFNTSLYVFGINKSTQENDLRNLFENFKIDKIEIKSGLELVFRFF